MGFQIQFKVPPKKPFLAYGKLSMGPYISHHFSPSSKIGWSRCPWVISLKQCCQPGLGKYALSVVAPTLWNYILLKIQVTLTLLLGRFLKASCSSRAWVRVCRAPCDLFVRRDWWSRGTGFPCFFKKNLLLNVSYLMFLTQTHL